MLGSYGRALDNDDLLKLLRSRVKSAGGQSAFARQHGIVRTYLNTVLNGKKSPGGPSILDALRLCVAYRPVERRDRADARCLTMMTY
jgi:DNA-binding phage protein